MRASTVLSLTGATVVTGFLGYAAYFDYKRRNDPAFRSKLKKDQKRTSKELKKQNEQRKKRTEETIQRTVDELNKPGALPSSASEKEEIFMQSVQEGEMLVAQGPELYVAAAAAFYRGMKVYPQPMELLTIYRKAVPEEALNYIFEMLSRDPEVVAGTQSPDALMAALAQASRGAPTAGQLEEVDDESPNKDPISNESAAAATTTSASSTASPSSAPLSSQGAESTTGSVNNGDNSSQEWEKVSNQHEEEVVTATDEQLKEVGQETLKEVDPSFSSSSSTSGTGA